MPKIKVDVTINSRQYTIIADENEEYIKKLADNINDKVKSVLKGGQNVMGERPLVLAALNICDEYYKCEELRDALKIKLDNCEKKLKESETELKNTGYVKNAEAAPQISFDEAEAEKEIKEKDKQIAILEDRLKNANRVIEDKNLKIRRLEEQKQSVYRDDSGYRRADKTK